MPSEKLKVLIAEDNPGLARVLSFKFKSSGYEPITCGNGGDAWKSFCDSQVAAVISDHEMPILSGIELIERIRGMDQKIPCFLVTGRQLELSRDPRVLKLGIQEVFGKPFSPATVVSAVTDSINLHSKQSGAENATVAAPPISVPNQSNITGARA